MLTTQKVTTGAPTSKVKTEAATGVEDHTEVVANVALSAVETVALNVAETVALNVAPIEEVGSAGVIEAT